MFLISFFSYLSLFSHINVRHYKLLYRESIYEKVHIFVGLIFRLYVLSRGSEENYPILYSSLDNIIEEIHPILCSGLDRISVSEIHKVKELVCKY